MERNMSEGLLRLIDEFSLALVYQDNEGMLSVENSIDLTYFVFLPEDLSSFSLQLSVFYKFLYLKEGFLVNNKWLHV